MSRPDVVGPRINQYLAGIRIRSNRTRGGLVEDVLYKDICIRKQDDLGTGRGLDRTGQGKNGTPTPCGAKFVPFPVME